MTLAEYKELTAKEKLNNNKYGARKVYVDGIKFDSKHESDRYRELVILQRAGEISDLKLQVPFELIPKQDGERACCYKADFTYIENGQLVVEDAKGYKTEVYKLKKKLMLKEYGIKIREV